MRVLDPAGSRRRPDVVIVNLNGRQELAIGQVREVAHRFPHATVVVYGLESAESLPAYVEAGAHGYVPAAASVAELCDVLEAAAHGEMRASPEAAFALFHRLAEVSEARSRKAVLDSLVLTRRELEILKLIAAGLGNREIAERLSLSFHTVKNHVQNTFQKIGTTKRIDAIAYARARGWLL
jgi:two-component system NarL family response regulator